MPDDDTGQGPFGFDPRAFQHVPLFRELAKMMSWQGGPVNWELAQQMAAGIVGEPRPAIGVDADQAALADAVRVAEGWLDGVVGLPTVVGPVRTFSAAEWVAEAASPQGLGVYVEPLAAGMRDALGGQLPEELTAISGPLQQAMFPVSAMLAGMQAGMITGHLAGQLLTTYDLGLPTVAPETIGTVGDAAARFAASFDVAPVELRFWLALRDAVHRRLFVGVPWLRGRVAELIGRFAAAADFDPGQLSAGLGGLGLDPEALADPSRLEELVERAGALALEPTPQQREVLASLQALVSLVQGYADAAVAAAAADRLTALPRIQEAALRRRAERGPGEQFLSDLIGLDLKPADVRQGKAFCEAVVAARGWAGLERAWAAPDRLPTPAEVADPSRWLVRMAGLEAADGVVPDLPDDSDMDVPDDPGAAFGE